MLTSSLVILISYTLHVVTLELLFICDSAAELRWLRVIEWFY